MRSMLMMSARRVPELRSGHTHGRMSGGHGGDHTTGGGASTTGREVIGMHPEFYVCAGAPMS